MRVFVRDRCFCGGADEHRVRFISLVVSTRQFVYARGVLRIKSQKKKKSPFVKKMEQVDERSSSNRSEMSVSSSSSDGTYTPKSTSSGDDSEDAFTVGSY